jgi:O-antigen/teichoic acid export membrane protein
LPRVGAATTAHDLGDVYRELTPALVLTVLACAGAAILFPILVPLVFGPEYHDAGWVASIYVAQYPLVACYMPVAVAFTFFGRSRWQVELPAVLLAVKAVGLLLVTPNLYLMAATAAVAHAVGVGYVAWRWRSMRAMRPVDVEGSVDT